MPIFAAIAAITAVAGAASTIQGLSAQSANKADIKERNKAASFANDEVGVINDKVLEESKNQNVLLRQDVREKNEIISSTNAKLTESNSNLLALNEATNEAISGSNEERKIQVGLANDQAGITSSRSRKQAVREALLLRGRTLNLAANSGAGLDSSGVQGGLGSLQTQLADTLGFASQDSSIANEIFQSSQREQDLVNKAQQLGFDTSLENLKALEIQRKAETDLQLQQNASNLRISKSNNKINILQNKAARIKEEAQLDPGEFVDARENTLAILNRKIDAANNKGEVAAIDNDGAFLTKLADGGIKKTYANGTVIKRRANGTRVSITPDGIKTITKTDGTTIVSEVSKKQIENVIAKVKPLVDKLGTPQEPSGGGGF